MTDQPRPICGWPTSGTEPCGEDPVIVYLTFPVPSEEFRDGRYVPVPSVLPLCSRHAENPMGTDG